MEATQGRDQRRGAGWEARRGWGAGGGAALCGGPPKDEPPKWGLLGKGGGALAGGGAALDGGPPWACQY